MKPIHPLHGLVAATHTPFHSDRSVNLGVIEQQADHLLQNGITIAFVNGTTGECPSLSVDERLRLAKRWFDVARGTELRLAVHVGSNSLVDSRELAAQAERLGAISISAFSPSYFKPDNVDALVSWCADLASAAPETPFYFYDIPLFTQVALPMPEFLEEAAQRVPTLAGLKYTNPDLMAYQLCLHALGGRFDVAYGFDQWVLAALALGARGAVGSTYNIAAPVYLRLMQSFAVGDLVAARQEQLCSVRLIQLLARYGIMGATKAVMAILGVDVGPVRPPNRALTADETRALHRDLETLGFFDWIKPASVGINPVMTAGKRPIEVT